jgi:hypothetical protein
VTIGVALMVAVALGLVVVVAVLVSRSRHSTDGVDSFRRQIDALSPEARRPVIDQMYGTSGRNEPPTEPPTEQSGDTAPDTDDGGPHGP